MLRVSHQAHPVPPEKAAGQTLPEAHHSAHQVSAAALRTEEEGVRPRGSRSTKIPSFGEQEKEGVGLHLPELEGKMIAGPSLPEKKEITHTLAINLQPSEPTPR